MKHLVFIVLVFFTFKSFAQTKNFIDLPYIETSAMADTLVIPDKIYLKIIIAEKDNKGKIAVEELENKMISQLNAFGIDTKKQLTINDVSSNFKKYFLKQQDILKTKEYLLQVDNSKTVGKVIIGLEELGIANVSIDHTIYSKEEQLRLILTTKAVEKAKNQALFMAKATNQKVGDAIFISDVPSNDYDIANSLNGRVTGIVMTGYGGKDKYEQPDIEIQKIQIISKVNVKFKLQ